METSANQPSSSTPKPVSQTPLPELYQPATAAIWSWVLSPVFGAFCIQKNWQTLDCPERARRARYWLIGLAVYTALLLLLTNHAGLLFLGNFTALAAWYFFECRTQMGYLNLHQTNYTSKSWTKTVLGGICSWGIALAVITLIMYLLDSSPVLDMSTQKAFFSSGKAIGEYIRKEKGQPLIDKEFREEKLSEQDLVTYEAILYLDKKIYSPSEAKPWDGLSAEQILDRCRQLVRKDVAKKQFLSDLRDILEPIDNKVGNQQKLTDQEAATRRAIKLIDRIFILNDPDLLAPFDNLSPVQAIRQATKMTQHYDSKYREIHDYLKNKIDPISRKIDNNEKLNQEEETLFRVWSNIFETYTAEDNIKTLEEWNNLTPQAIVNELNSFFQNN